MKNVAIFCFFVLISECLTLERRCKCWTGYKPERDKSGFVECNRVYINALARTQLPIVPCNYPKKPNCKCRSGFVGELSIDGTYCKMGNQRTSCTNVEDYETYLRKLRIYIDEELYVVY